MSETIENEREDERRPEANVISHENVSDVSTTVNVENSTASTSAGIALINFSPEVSARDERSVLHSNSAGTSVANPPEQPEACGKYSEMPSTSIGAAVDLLITETCGQNVMVPYSTLAGIDVDDNIATAYGQIRISDSEQFGTNVMLDFDPNIIEENYQVDAANDSCSTDDSDVVLVAEYYETDDDAQHHEITQNIKHEQ